MTPTISIENFLRDVLGMPDVRLPSAEKGGKDNITQRVPLPSKSSVVITSHGDRRVTIATGRSVVVHARETTTDHIVLPSGERIVVQAMRGIRDAHHADFIRRVLTHIERSPYPIRVAPSFGKRFYEYEGIWYQVMGELSGRILTESDGIAYLADHARTLAYFHLATDDFDARGYENINYHRQLPKFRAMATEYARTVTDSEILDLWKELEVRYPTTSDIPDLPCGVIWGDPAFKNCLVDNNTIITGIIDYDMLSVTTRLWDLADVARAYMKIPTFDRGSIYRLLDAYESVRPITPEERRAYPEYLKRMILDTGYRYFLSLFADSGYYAELGWAREKCWRCVREIDRAKAFW